ncbi:phosphoglycerate kinase, partial [Patescibacteria group bacterium]|nr:phosphoglycerate kinase [Patescibacteria group bacterium]
PVAIRIEELLKSKIKFVDDCIGDKARKAAEEMKSGEIILLENLRFYKEEEENNEKFAKELASFGDLYINDAFSDSHRKHASIVGITKYLPSCAGLLMEKEIEMMQAAIKPKRPAIAIIGGVKLETKSPAVNNLAKIYDYVLVGGMVANEMIKSKFLHSLALNIILPAKENLIKEKHFDIGHNTVKEFSKFIQKAKTIVWNGPMGMFEDSKYQAGTKGVIELIKSARKNGANVLIGGGETIYALRKFAPELMNKKIMDSISSPQENFNISTGGGAMLEFLAGNDLPGIEALKK